MSDFDFFTGTWSLYWASKRTGTLSPPVTGKFDAGKGEFFGEDTYNDVSILARFRWTGITADSAHWEQAFSTDGGQTWLDNWYMEATKRPLTAAVMMSALPAGIV